jgi:P4 family phage/plasmid primase-like protien
MGKMAIDLRTGQTRKTVAEDYFTKIMGAPYCAKPGTPHPLWDQFLRRVTAEESDLTEFLQRFLGYCLTGNVHEQVLMFLFGTGANGKSVFVNTVAKIFGTYATVCPMEMFLMSHVDRHPAEIAKLRGVRLAIAQEIQKGRRWDEAKIKNLTDGGYLTARYMRGEWFDFRPTHKLLIVGNHKPSLSGVDEAIRRRFLLVPFTVQIPPDERDPRLIDKLEPEWPAITRWIVEGTLKWRETGLMIPKTVRDATDEYLADQDAITQWIGECVETYPDAFIKTADLFASWRTWAERRNLAAATMTAFAESLTDKGYQKKNMTYGRGFKGIMLKPERRDPAV